VYYPSLFPDFSTQTKLILAEKSLESGPLQDIANLIGAYYLAALK
jgi:hypothetical protein